MAILHLLLTRQALCCYLDLSMSSIHHSTLCILHLSWANKPKCNQTICLVQVYYSVLKNLLFIIILLVQVKLIPSEVFLDDLTNPYSLGNKTAHHFKIENKVSSFWMTYKQDVAFGIKRKRGNVQECITKDFKSKCIVNCSSLLLKISLLRLSWIPSPLGIFYCLLFRHNYKKWTSLSNG